MSLSRAVLCAWAAACLFWTAAAAESAASGSAPAPPAPPAGVSAADTPNDAGGSITLTWTPAREETVLVLRATSAGGPFDSVATAPGDAGEFTDTKAVDGTGYYYRLDALRGGERAIGPVLGPARSRGNWFHTRRVNTLVALVLLSALIIYFIERARRGREIFVRKIAGLDAVDEAVGRATEMGRKILYIPGTQDMDNVQTLAGVAILGRVARMTARYETALEVPLSRSLVMVASREVMKESYLAEGRPDSYHDEMVYYLTDDQFGFAAALDGIMTREKPAAIFLQGCFYAESLILAETGNSVGAIQIAGTAEPSQLPFFVAACDYTLIGEELFLAGAYLSREPRQLGSLKGQDMGKAIILLLLLVGILVQTLGLFDFASLFVVQ